MLRDILYSGSDEVGTGEYFGPIVVVALRFNNLEAYEYAKKIGVKDSKDLINKDILRISEQLRDKVEYSAKIFTPLDYHNISNKFNLNHIKFKLHIEAHNSLNSGLKRVIDKFTTKKSMLKYSKDLGLSFGLDDYILEEKAENKYLEVAAAAIIAKRIWINWMDDFLKKEGFNFDFNETFSVIQFHKELIAGNVKIKKTKEFMKPWPINKELLKQEKKNMIR